MPSYPKGCDCGYRGVVIKSIRDFDLPDPCPECEAPMWTNYASESWAGVGVSVFKAHFNPSLGQYVGSQRDVKDAQNKIKDATGSMPIELGNEKPKYKPVRQEFDVREALAYAEKIQVERGETPNG